MNIVHFVMSDTFAGIEQHVDELLSNNLLNNPILICNESIALNFNQNIEIFKIKNYGRRSLIGKYQIKKLLKRIKPDIVHTHGAKTTAIISRINKNDFKHVATVHGVKKNTKIFEKPDFIIGVSDTVIRGINNKSLVISNWWHPNLYKFKDKNNKYALAIGRLEQVKGFDLLITAWKKINKELLIVGSGKEKNKLLSLIKNNNLTKKIKIIDNVNKDELYEIYRDAALLIISSRYEGGPRVALEALHLEIPVISTNVGHMDEILPKELLAKKDDQQSLKDLLEKYVDNINILNQDAVFEFVTDEYSITKKINEIKKIYKSLSTS
jgi:glycosyltransferase involved in cell wall biosynthesis